MPRVFSAIEIEDSNIQQRLKEIRNETDRGFKPVPEEKMHITLQFFKDIDKRELEKVKQALNSVDKNSFKAEIKGLGAFPSKDYIRVIWAGIESDEIYDLKEQVSNHRVESSNSYEFKPHITLHRVENLKNGDKKYLHKKFEKYRDRKIADLNINEVKLFESILEEDGSRYEELEVKRLK